MKKLIITAILGIFFAAVMSIAAGAADWVSAEIDAPDYILPGQTVTVNYIITFDSDVTYEYNWFHFDFDDSTDWDGIVNFSDNTSGNTFTFTYTITAKDDCQRQDILFSINYYPGWGDDIVIATKTVTLVLKTYNITYDANGGSGTMAGKTVGVGDMFTLPACTFTPPAGKIFDAWEVQGVDHVPFKAGERFEIVDAAAYDSGNITITAHWKDAYSIIIQQPEHGKIYASATEAEVGTEIRLTAVPDEGYELAEWLDYSGVIMDDDRFIMPPGNVIISAVFKMIERTSPVPNPYNEDTPAGIALPTLRVSDVKASGNTATLSWGKYPYAESYTVFMSKNGVKRKLRTTKRTSITVTGLKNAETYQFTVAANIGTWSSPDYLAGTVTITPYFKPLVNAIMTDDGAKLGWKSVPDAESYIIYKLVNGKLKKIAETTGTSALITGLTDGKEYIFAVKAVINGEKTLVKKSDLVTVKL